MLTRPPTWTTRTSEGALLPQKKTRRIKLKYLPMEGRSGNGQMTISMLPIKDLSSLLNRFQDIDKEEAIILKRV